MSNAPLQLITTTPWGRRTGAHLPKAEMTMAGNAAFHYGAAQQSE
jgi:hypothetical protein